MNSEYLILLAVYSTGLLIRAVYESLKKDGKLDRRNWRVFAVVFTAMILMWASWFSLVPLDPWRLALPDPIRWIALGAVVLGLVIAVGALTQLRGVENIDHLVTSGFFSKLRHPMYIGFIAWFLGWSIYHGAIVSLVAGLVGIRSVLNWRQLEDEDLEKRYGHMYREYRAGTWF